MLRIVKDQAGVILFLILGLYFSLTALHELDLGSFRRMGPGFFPLAIGVILCGLATLQLALNFRHRMSVGTPDLKAMLPVVLSVTAFCIFTPLLGVIAAVALSIFFSCFAISNMPWSHRIGLALVVAILCWLVFIVALRLPFEPIRGLA